MLSVKNEYTKKNHFHEVTLIFWKLEIEWKHSNIFTKSGDTWDMAACRERYQTDVYRTDPQRGSEVGCVHEKGW